MLYVRETLAPKRRSCRDALRHKPKRSRYHPSSHVFFSPLPLAFNLTSTMDLAVNLIKTVMRAFYQTRDIIVIDALILHEAYVTWRIK